MTKSMILKELEEKLTKGHQTIQCISKRIFIFYKEDFQGIIKLKKEFRLLTKKYDDFYKRSNGFYNKDLDIFLYKDNENIDTFLATVFYVDNEKDADVIADAMLDFINIFYDRKTYYIVSLNSQNYKIDEEKLNIYEHLRKCVSKGTNVLGIFNNQNDAYKTILEHLDNRIQESEKELLNLKRKRIQFSLLKRNAMEKE